MDLRDVLQRRGQGWLLCLCCAVVAVWGFAVEPRLLVERRETLHSPRWQGVPLDIAFVSDLHVGGPHIDLAYLDRLVERINAGAPDLILLGGDFVSKRETQDIDAIAEHLAPLRAPLGVYAVLGNHEWWSDAQAMRAALSLRGIVVLENTSQKIGHCGMEFQLAGIGDNSTGHADITAALAPPPPAPSFPSSGGECPRPPDSPPSSVPAPNAALPLIVLTHDPSLHPQLPADAALVLAGHTHGGQVYLPFVGAPVVPYPVPRHMAYGWVREEGSAPMFVTGGVGTSILPIRLNMPSEYVLLRLQAAGMQ